MSGASDSPGYETRSARGIGVGSGRRNTNAVEADPNGGLLLTVEIGSAETTPHPFRPDSFPPSQTPNFLPLNWQKPDEHNVAGVQFRGAERDRAQRQALRLRDGIEFASARQLVEPVGRLRGGGHNGFSDNT